MSLTQDLSKAGIAAVATAFENGITIFDNADVYPNLQDYGQSEKILGKALKENSIARDRVVITSKAGICAVGTPQNNEYKSYNASRSWLREQVENSLKNLQTDYIDIFFLHRIDHLTHASELAETARELIAEGKVKGFGLSNHNVHELRAFYAHGNDVLVALQNRLNILQSEPLRDGLHAVAMEWDLPFFAYSPLAGGALAKDKQQSL